MARKLKDILMGKLRGDERGIVIKNSSRNKLSGGVARVAKDGKQDQDATTHMNINNPNSEQVIEENLSKCETLDPLDLHFKERIQPRIQDFVKKTLYENGPEHSKNSITVTEDRQESMQPPRSMQVNIIIHNSDFQSPRREVVKGRDRIFTEECSAKQAASERKYLCVCNSKQNCHIHLVLQCLHLSLFTLSVATIVSPLLTLDLKPRCTSLHTSVLFVKYLHPMYTLGAPHVHPRCTLCTP